MKKTIENLVNTIYIFLICLGAVLVVIGAIYEIVGPARFKQFFMSIGIPSGLIFYNAAGIIYFILLIITCYVKFRFFK